MLSLFGGLAGLGEDVVAVGLGALAADGAGFDESESDGLRHAWAEKALWALDLPLVAEVEGGARGGGPGGWVADEAGVDWVEFGVGDLGEDGVVLEELNGVVGLSVPELAPVAAVLVHRASEEGVEVLLERGEVAELIRDYEVVVVRHHDVGVELNVEALAGNGEEVLEDLGNDGVWTEVETAFEAPACEKVGSAG